MLSRRILGLLTGALAIAPTTACAFSPAPSAQESTPPTATADPTPSATSTPAPTETAPAQVAGELVVPSCDDLLPLDQLRDTVGPTTPSLESYGPQAPGDLSAMGPLATETLRNAASTVTCNWGIPVSDGVFDVTVAQIEPAARDDLIAALHGAADYDYAEPEGLPSFQRAVTSGIGTYLGYAFDGLVWVIVDGTVVYEDSVIEVAADAARAVTLANG